jgi:hypothetical protein
MLAASDPDLLVAQIAIGGLVLAGFWQLIAWVRNAPIRPDPWDAEFEQKMQDPDTPETCHHCSTPQLPGAWFCSHCGRAVGPYNNLMPYVQVFSEGEVFRNGTSGQFRNRPLILLGYFLISVGMFSFFAPIYWISMLLNWKRSARPQKSVREQNIL